MARPNTLNVQPQQMPPPEDGMTNMPDEPVLADCPDVPLSADSVTHADSTIEPVATAPVTPEELADSISDGPSGSMVEVAPENRSPSTQQPEFDDTRGPRPAKGIVRGVISFTSWSIRGVFCIISLVVLLATLTAIPIFQFIAFGYLLSVAGGLAAGARLRECLPHLRQAGQIGLAALAIILAALPTQLLAHWESVAYLIDPDSNQAIAMRALAITCSALATLYLLWAWVRGGRLRHYLWPQPKRFLREGWRWRTWKTAPDRLWSYTAALELPRYFWLGVRGAIGTLIWLIPAMIIVAAFRVGETGLAGLVGFVALVFLGISMLYLPMLQAHFAAENRFSALFEVRTIRRNFRSAPWAWLLAMITALVLTPIPLYLLKIEATPREVMWLPCLVFISFILPARIATGLALRRARRRDEWKGTWARISRWIVRLSMLIVVAVYLLFLYVSQYTSWDGLQTWVQQHAILIPVPFLDGV